MTANIIEDLIYHMRTAHAKWASGYGQGDYWNDVASALHAAGYSDRHLTPAQRSAVENLRHLLHTVSPRSAIGEAIHALAMAFPRTNTPVDRPSLRPEAVKPQFPLRYGQPDKARADDHPDWEFADTELKLIQLLQRKEGLIGLAEDGSTWLLDEEAETWIPLNLPPIKVAAKRSS